MDPAIEDSKSSAKKNMLIFVILLVLLVLVLVSFVRSLDSFYSTGQLRIHHRNQQISSEQINNIRGWMTFDYINVVFKLSSDYLKNGLNITDPKYPNLRIDQYAKKQKINVQQVLLTIQQLINGKPSGKI